MKYQSPKEIIDTTNWEYDFDNPVFPEGSRDKNLVISPGIAPYSFLKNNFAYLFKLSRQRYPSQFWIEIIAYRVGCLMGIEVPPAFVAYNKTKDQSASLIEWFYDQSSSAPVRESYIRGGQIMDRLYNDYDHEKGRKHNVYALMKYSNLLCKRGCVSEPINFWAKTFIFDAIIGNTDRHQENWGIIENKRFEKILSARFSPAFDNGTSLGHEIMETKLKEFADPNRILTYIKKGKHHVKWHLKESKQCGHFELITRFIEKYPSSRETILDCLKFDEEELKKYVYELSEFDVKDKISEERCQFVVNLILKRREIISEALSI